MPGGWTMSMTWMRMPGQTWLDAAAVFVGMWVVMMVAMMLPSLAPLLWRYRQAAAPLTEGEIRLDRQVAMPHAHNHAVFRFGRNLQACRERFAPRE